MKTTKPKYTTVRVSRKVHRALRLLAKKTGSIDRALEKLLSV